MAAETDPLNIRDLLAAVTSSVVSALPVFLVAALALQIRESLHFGPAQLGFVVSLYYLSAAVTSIPLSRLAEAIGSLRVMRLGCLVMALLLITVAGAVRSLGELAVLTAATGIVSAGVQPATNLFLIRRIPRRHHGLAFGVKQAAVPMAVLLGGVSVPAIALTVGWRWAFVSAAVIAILASVFQPRSRTSFAAYRALPAVARLGRADRLHLALLATGFGLGVSAASALSAFTVTSAAAAGQGTTAAGLLAGLGGAVAAGTRIGVGIQADRGNRNPLLVVGSMLGVGTLGYVMLALSASQTAALLVPGMVLAYSAGWGWNGLFNLAISSQYSAQAARASGIASVGGRTGGVAGPFVFGIVVTHSSYTAAWLLASAAALIGALIIVANRRPPYGLATDPI